MSYQLYWGDLHSHCSISYGHGTVEQALMRARGQLDFCSITGHAFWPDMPTDRGRYGEIIDYHNEGFATLARNWPELIAKQSDGSVDSEFLVLPSYEWHSLEYGDHNVYSRGPELPLADAPNLPALRDVARQSDAIMIPHHIGYAAGHRGIDWKYFREERSPFVEIFSLHGCSVSDDAPYPMLHDMGPRDAGSTAEAGWAAGHRFGIVGGTDHHGAYPGSHGDGRMGVFATELSRDAIWEAFLARRVFAATGDPIDARLFVDDAWIGSSIQTNANRKLRVLVRALDSLDRVEVLKNGRILRRFFPETNPPPIQGKFRLRITWGWGRKDQPVDWEFAFKLSTGTITDVQTCFSGQTVAAPKGVAGHSVSADEEDLPHAITERGERQCNWRSVTTGNTTLRHATTQAISLELDSPLEASITLEANGQPVQYSLEQLIHSGHVQYQRGWLSEAVRVGPLVPEEECQIDAEFVDEPELPVDRYYLRIAQRNGQWAWLTPVWAEQ